MAATTQLTTTARLTLRALDANYLDAIAAMMRDPRVNEYFYGFQKVADSAELPAYTADYFLKPFAETEAAFGIGGMAVHARGATDNGPGAFAGITGFFPPTGHHPEYGPELVYILGADYHGNGYAFEAVAAAVEHARGVTDLDWLSLTTDAPNTASRRVAEKLGFTEFGEVAAYGADDMVFYTLKLR